MVGLGTLNCVTELEKLKSKEKKLSASNLNAEKFISEFIKLTESENCNERFIYNPDECGLNWRFLPRQTLASANEKSVLVADVSKEIIRMLLCSNETGSHRLPLLVIGHSKKASVLSKCENTACCVYKSM